MILRAVIDQVLDLLEAEPELAERVRVVLGAGADKAAPRLLDRAELAAALKVSPASLDRLRGEPAFPEVRIGDAPRFEFEAVLRWLRSRADRPDDGNVVHLRRRAK
ncbi:MAG: hypothetical protein HS104_06875 [Polyangiaceae bacterium]|nr:hypothetical protein [Polyangiaceae bacterium]